MAVSDYSTTPGDNTSISGITVSDATVADQLDNIVRQMMADIAAWYATDKVVYDTPASGYRVIGTTLECWGAAPGTGHQTITFPKTFNAAPTVMLSAGASGPRMTNAYSVTTTGFEGEIYLLAGTEATTNTFSYYAVGEWDGVS